MRLFRRTNARTRQFLTSANILANPNDLGNASWDTKTNITVTTNVISGPGENIIADKLTPTSTNNSDHFVVDSLLTTTAVPWTLKGIFKAAGYNYVELLLANNGTFTKYFGGYFDLRTGLVVSERGVTYTGTKSIVALGEGWYRCSITVTVEANSTHRADVRVGNTSTAGAAYAGDTVSGIYGCMVEFYPT